MGVNKELKNITVGLLGLDFTSTNMGCAALAYSCLGILNDRVFSGQNVKYIIITVITNKKIQNLPEGLKYEHVMYRPRKIRSNAFVTKKIKECDVILDFTAGDSFSDIYGTKKYLAVSYNKIKALLLHKRLILGPQTYGPITGKFNGFIFNYIVKNSYRVYSRDLESSAFVESFSKVRPKTYIDVAFSLGYDRNDINTSDEKKKIGINVSGLLWNGGYTNDNQFGLRVNYKEYITKLVEYLSKDFSYEIHLIPHVISGNYDSPDNDYKAIEQLQASLNDCIVAPRFSSPMEAKTYISKMDIFTGARMHATIAAMSSGVAVIPFSYSRKFEGLFNTLDYPYCIDGCVLDTDEALSLTIKYIENAEELSIRVRSGKIKADQMIESFVGELSEAMEGIAK